MSKNKGLTLLEILIVLAILMIIAGAIYGTIISLGPSLKLKSATRDLVTDLRYSQQQAVTEQINFGLTLYPAANDYQIIRYATTGDEVIATKSLPSEISFDSVSGFTNDKVIFNPYGAALEMGTISIKNNESEIKNIEVRPSGFVRSD